LPDLVSRMAVFPVRLVPLRERRADVRGLAEHFLRKVARRNARAATTLSADALQKLAAYAWPGNVRELENVIERAAILARGDVIQAEHLAFARPAASAGGPTSSRTGPASIPPGEAGLGGSTSGAAISARTPDGESTGLPRGAGDSKIDLDSQLDDIERRELLAALQRCGGNKAEVARSLGVQRTTLYYRLKRLGIDL
jgi:two-component system, NtrC family, response regulator AtoC